MPEIRQYQSPIDSLRPSETGIEAFAQAGAKANRIFTELAGSTEQVGRMEGQAVGQGIEAVGKDVVDYIDHRQIANAGTATSELTLQASRQWNNTINGWTDQDGTYHPPADPRDPGLQDRFLQSLEPQFDKLRQTVNTPKAQAWMESHIDEMRNSFRIHTTADMGSLAADAATLNLRQSTNSAISTAAMNPSMTDDLLKQTNDRIDAAFGSNPYLKGAAGDKVRLQASEKAREQIVTAAAISAIRHSPNPEATAQEWGNKYGDLIPNFTSLASQARSESRLQAIEDRSAKADDRRALTAAWHQKASKLEDDLIKEGPDGRMAPNTPPNLRRRLSDLASDPNAEPGRYQAIVAKVEHDGLLLDETTRSNIEKKSKETQAALFASGANPLQVNAEYSAHKGTTLTWADKEALINNYNADKSEVGAPLAAVRKDYLTANRGNLDPATVIANLHSPQGMEANFKAEQALRQAEAQEHAKPGGDPQNLYKYDPATGKSPADAIIEKYKVPMSALPNNLREMLGDTSGATAAPGHGAPPLPAPLQGLASPAWSPSLRIWVDQTTRKRYSPTGEEIK